MQPMRPQVESWPTIAIVACTASKLSHRAKARDLYTPSALFRKSVEEAEAEGLPIVILSSRYGVLLPEDEVDTYERDLKTMSSTEIQEWRHLVAGQLKTLVGTRSIREAAFFAGKDYREATRPALEALGVQTFVHGRWKAICDEAFGR